MNENQTHQLGAQISCLVILPEILREIVGLMQLRFGSVYLCITESSLHRAVTLFFQAMGAVCCLYFLGSTHDVNFAARFARRGLAFSHGKLAADCEMERIFSNQDLLRQSGLRKPWVWQAAEALHPGLEHYPVTVPQFRQWAETQNAYLFHEGRMKQDGTKEMDL